MTTEEEKERLKEETREIFYKAGEACAKAVRTYDKARDKAYKAGRAYTEAIKAYNEARAGE